MMRVWSSRFEGLHLSLSPGWYALPAHIEGIERQRLLDLIAAGIEEIAYVVELELDAVETLGQRLELRQTLALVRVPATVEMSEAILRELRAKLGSVRVGLVQPELPGDWPELAWQERQIKAPLLAWLRQQLHAAEHPLARLGLRALPVDELARYTPEPVELLVMLEGVIAHRMRYSEGEATAEDWERSIVQVVLERFASRFGTIADKQAEALELIIVHRDESVVSMAEVPVGARALAHAGLASIGGNDVLLGPLVKFAGQRDKLPRLLPLLQDSAWSPVSRRELGRAMPSLFMLPRAVLVAPEPPYSRWPALIPPMPEPLGLLVGLASDPGITDPQDWAHKLLLCGALPQQQQLPGLDSAPWVDGVLTLLNEVGDLHRLEIDLEQGRFYRFDTIDRDWSEAEQGPEVRVYLRWLALSLLLRHVHDTAVLVLIEDQLSLALELASSPALQASIHALHGDLHAHASRYSMALAAWERAANKWEEAREANVPYQTGKFRLYLRRVFGHLRLDRVDLAWALTSDGVWALMGRADDIGFDIDFVVHQGCHELLTLAGVWAERLAVELPPDFSPGRLVNLTARRSAPALTVTQAAVALELGDWPRALALTQTIEPTLESPEGARAQLLSATIRGALGEVDAAASMVAALRERARESADALLLALSNRALASFPDKSRDPIELQAALEAAAELELELGLPDAQLIELERAGWAMVRGTIDGEQYQAVLARLKPAASRSPSLAGASMQAQLRMIALFIASAHARGETPPTTLVEGLVALVTAGVKGREISPWFDRACEELLESIQAHLDAGEPEQALALVTAMRRLVADDARYLAELERLEALARA